MDYSSKFKNLNLERHVRDDSLLKRMIYTDKICGHRGCVNCICWTYDGKFLLTGSDDKNVSMWNMDSNPKKKRSLYYGHKSNVFSIAILPAINHPIETCRIISGSNDADCRIFDPETGKCLNILTEFQKKIYHISVPQTCLNTFMCCSADGTIRQYDVRQKMNKKQRRNNNAIVPQFLGGGFFDNTTTEPLLKNLLLDFGNERGDIEVLSVNHHPLNTNIFITSVLDGSVYLFDRRRLKQDKPLKCYLKKYFNSQFRKPEIHEPTYACFNETGEEILISYTHDCMYLFKTDAPEKNLQSLFESSFSYVQRYDDEILYPKQYHIIENSQYGYEVPQVRVRNRALLLNQLDPYISQYSDLNYEQRIDIINIENHYIDPNVPKNYLQRFKGHIHSQTVKKSAFYGNEHVMTGSDDGNVYIYNKKSGKIAMILEGSGEIINVTEKSPTSPVIATSGLEDFVRIWTPEERIDNKKKTKIRLSRLINRSRYGSLRGLVS